MVRPNGSTSGGAEKGEGAFIDINRGAQLPERKAPPAMGMGGGRGKFHNGLTSDDDSRADSGAAIEVDHVVVGHADTAGRDRLADGVGFVRAVDAEERAGDIHRAGAE